MCLICNAISGFEDIIYIFNDESRHKINWEEVDSFIRDGKPVIGICNGYQVLVRGGFLPDLSGNGEQEVTLTYNDSGRFEDRWVNLTNGSDRCIFTRDIETIELPVRHGEGKFVTDDETLRRLHEEDLVVFRYAGRDGEANPPYPLNPNAKNIDIYFF